MCFLRKISGAQIIYNKLLHHGVKDVFAYSGGAIMPLLDKFYLNNAIKMYINTHEQCAGHAATGYAKTTGKPGIAIMTSGPGVTNSVTSLTDATYDSTPHILFTGNVGLNAIGTNAFQECPAIQITKPITKWSYMVDNVDDMADVVDEAFRVATSGKPGSVHIDLPKCILNATLDIDEYSKNSKNSKKSRNQLFEIKHIAKSKKSNRVKTNQIVKLLNIAKKPVILVGQGCNNYSEELRKFALKSNIPVTTTIHAMGVFDETHDLSLEFLGMHGNIAANYAIQNADLIIALGTRFDDRITGSLNTYAPKAFEAYRGGCGGIVHVNINNEEIGNILDTHFNYHADCGVFLDSLNSANILFTSTDRIKWLNQVAEWKRRYKFVYNSTDDMKTQEVLEAFNTHLIDRDDYIVTSGVGNHQMMASQFIKWRYPKTFISSGSLGVMGVGLPYAIGCQIANPAKLVIDIDGDGSFNHTSSELKTVNDYNLPIKIAIMNDGHLSMVRTWEKLFFDERYVATNLHQNPDYVKLAESYGIRGIRCNNRDELHDKIAEFLAYDKAILCDFRVTTDECFPLVKPGSALDDIIFPHSNSNVVISMKNILPPN